MAAIGAATAIHRDRNVDLAAVTFTAVIFAAIGPRPAFLLLVLIIHF